MHWYQEICPDIFIYWAVTNLEKSGGCANPGLEHIGDFYEWFCAVIQPDILAKGVIDMPAHPSLAFRNVKWTYMQKLHYQQGDEVHSRVLNQWSYVANMYLHVIVLIMWLFSCWLFMFPCWLEIKYLPAVILHGWWIGMTITRFGAIVVSNCVMFDVFHWFNHRNMS